MINRRGLIACIIFLVFFLAKAFFFPDAAPQQYYRNEGTIFGTIYHITYESKQDLHAQIKTELQKFDASLSVFNKQSTITKVNINDSNLVIDPWFAHLFTTAKTISLQTEGAFDLTVGPLVNAWGFGFQKMEQVTPEVIDSLEHFVGFEKIDMVKGKIIKQDPRVILNASAIAKGYACDVIGDYLMKQGVQNFMVEIGGEVTVNGKNPRAEAWRIGINKPIEDSLSTVGEIQEVIAITQGGMATSGNYRNYYYKDGKRYAHTIDPRTGYPVQHNLLSATVVAPTCMEADAYATAFMVLGLEKSLKIIEQHPQLDAFFIYEDEEGIQQTYSTEGIGIIE